MLFLSERIFASIALFFFSNGLFAFFLPGSLDSHGDQESPFLRLIFLLIYTLSFALLAYRWERTVKSLLRARFLLLTFMLVFLSLLWSSVPFISLRQVVALTGTTFFGIYFGTRFNFNEQLKILGWTFGLSTVLSLLFVLILPQYGVMNTPAIVGAWQGIYVHKNTLGSNMLLAVLTFYFLFQQSLKYRYVNGLLAILSSILLLFSEAATSLISLLFVICLLKALEFLSLKSKVKLHLVVISIAVSIVLSIVLIVNINSFLNASGKDVTLTGRTILWDSLGDYIKLKPMFGYGYGSFFSSAHQETQSLWEKFSWEPVHAHNGYIQILLFIGIAGFTIFLFGYLVYIIKTLHSYLLYRDRKLLWATSLLTYTILFNFTEISFLTSNNLTWVLSISSLYSIRLAKKTRLYVYKNNPIYLH